MRTSSYYSSSLLSNPPSHRPLPRLLLLPRQLFLLLSLASLGIIPSATSVAVAQDAVAPLPITQLQASARTPLLVAVAAEPAAPELPDSPGTLLASPTNSSSSISLSDALADPGDSPAQAQTAVAAGSTPKHAPHLEMVIRPGEIADPMTVKEKVVGGLKDSVSLFSAAGWLGAAGWEQLWNDSPNYGSDAGAFGQRLGAAAIRGISENVFSESLFAPLFHEDPRYYVMGKGHNFFKRAIYAGTRTIITRTDSGQSTINLALLAGNFSGSALTVPYYPSQNTSLKEVAITFGGSLGGSAVGFVVNEFIVDALEDLHIKKKQP